MSTGFLKESISGFRVPEFQLAYIRDTTHPSHKNLANLRHEVRFVTTGVGGLHQIR